MASAIRTTRSINKRNSVRTASVKYRYGAVLRKDIAKY